VKALLINATEDTSEIGYGGPEDGFGVLALDRSLFFAGDMRGLRMWDVRNAAGLRQGESRTFTVPVTAGEPLRAALVWTDPEPAMTSAVYHVNDLDLTVTSGATVMLGNVFDPSGAVSTSGGTRDKLNNVEMIVLDPAPSGDVEIVVSRQSVGRPERQGYALVITGLLP
jgi:hypothetical protein